MLDLHDNKWKIWFGFFVHPIGKSTQGRIKVVCIAECVVPVEALSITHSRCGIAQFILAHWLCVYVNSLPYRISHGPYTRTT